MFKWLYCAIFFLCSASVSAKVYDCFLFFNELELLEIRFYELYDKVDKFVLVEAQETFRGNPKPLHYQENKERFARFQDKIIYVCIEGHLPTSSPWTREEWQRNQIMRGLKECHDDDIIMISDLDEIVRAESVDKIKKLFLRKEYPRVHCEQELYRFYLNQRDFATQWIGTAAAKFSYLKGMTPHELRMAGSIPLQSPDGTSYRPILNNAGWHFTSLGGLQRVIEKLEAYSHSEYDAPEFKNEKAFKKVWCEDCKVVRINRSFPKLIIENLEKYKNDGLILRQ